MEGQQAFGEVTHALTRKHYPYRPGHPVRGLIVDTVYAHAYCVATLPGSSCRGWKIGIYHVGPKHIRVLLRRWSRHSPRLILTETLAGELPSDFQILPTDFRYWEFSTVSPKSDGEIRNSDGYFSARFSVRLKKGRCLVTHGDNA